MPQNADACRMRRRLRHDAVRSSRPILLTLTAKRHLLKEARHSGFPGFSLLRRGPDQVQKLGTNRPAVRKNHGFVWRAEAQIQQRELIFLRVVPSDLHVVHRARFWKEEGELPQQQAGHQSLTRSEAFKRYRRNEILVKGKKFMNPGGSRTPVSDNEDRRLEHGRRDASGKDQLLRDG